MCFCSRGTLNLLVWCYDVGRIVIFDSENILATGKMIPRLPYYRCHNRSNNYFRKTVHEIVKILNFKTHRITDRRIILLRNNIKTYVLMRNDWYECNET